MTIKTSIINTIVGSTMASRAVGKLGRVTLLTKAYSPEIHLSAGLVLGVVAAIQGARAYKRQDDILAEPIQCIKQERELVESAVIGSDVEAEHSAALYPLYGDLIGKVVRLYAPPVMLAGGSMFLILRAHGLLQGRNKALIATVGLLETAFGQYRERVVADQGEAADERYFFGADEKTTVRIETIDGKKKKVKTKSNVISETPANMLYSRVFDENHVEFGPDHDMNQFVMASYQRMFNDLLRIKGFVMLNDVLKQCGFPETPEGQVVGWSLYAKGDNFISFGLDAPINRNPNDSRIVLNYNVNGVVFEFLGMDQ